MTPDPLTRRLRLPGTLIFIIAAGAAFRLYPYCAGPSLIVDDAMLALNIATRSFTGLLHPLAFEQTAPPGFLWAEKLLTLLAGVNEYALRALPLAAAIALPFFIWRLARRLVGEVPALFAAALAAASPVILQYSVTAKPYVVDALVTVILLDRGLRVQAAPEDRTAWRSFGLAGAAGLLFSLPAVFVLAGTFAVLATSRHVRATPARRYFAGWGIALGAAFCAVYFGVTRAEASPYMRVFWAARFLPPASWVHPADAWNVVKRLPAGTLRVTRGLDEPTALFWLLAVCGAWRFALQARARALLVVAPLVVVLGAAAVSLYPISPRLDLFVAPVWFLLFAGALDWSAAWPRSGRIAVTVVAGLVVAAVALQERTLDPWGPALGPAAATFAREAGPTEPVYVFANATPAWTFYTTDWRHPDLVRVAAIVATQGAESDAFHNRASRGRAVSDTEGAGLVIRSGGRAELLGLATGMQYREGALFSRPAPDSGWAKREADRIRRAAAPGIWVVMAPMGLPGVSDLEREILRAGGRETRRWTGHLVTLSRYEFGP